jgi:uncharacterized protein (DUF2164 family)
MSNLPPEIQENWQDIKGMMSTIYIKLIQIRDRTGSSPFKRGLRDALATIQEKINDLEKLLQDRG